jgi:hypothetical protein
MRFRGLALFPLLYAAAVVAIASGLSEPALGPFISGQRILARMLAVAGCLAAVSAFERGDHLRSAWSWLAASKVVILIRDILRLFPAFRPGSSGPEAQMALGGLVLLANLALLVGIVKLARSWKMAAIAMPGGRAGQIAVAVVTAGVAIAVAGPSVLQSSRALAGGDWAAPALLISAVADIITLSLITPLFLTAVALRGGLFSWAWGLVTASELSWLLYDAASIWAPITLGGVPLPELFRGIAECFLCAAGLAQLFVVRQVRSSAARPPG